MFKLTSILIAFLFFGKANAQSSVYPLGTFSLDSSTQWLEDIFNNRISDSVKLVGLGEVTHGGHEIAEFKTKAVQYLIKNKGYRLFLFEYPNPALSLLNYYVTAQERYSTDTAQYLAIEAFQNSILDESLPKLFAWIKQFNLEHSENPVIIKGIDITGAYGSFFNYFMHNFSSLLDRTTQSKITKNKLSIDSSSKTIIQWINLHKDTLKVKLKEHYIELLYNAKCAELSINRNRNRDSVMAENINYLLLQYNKKGIVWAHNMHIAPVDWRNDKLLTKVLYPKVKYSYFGKILSGKMGERYYVILTDFSRSANVVTIPDGRKKFEQSKKTLAASLARKKPFANCILFYKDISTAQKKLPVSGIDLNGDFFLTNRTAKIFDALVIFNKISPAIYP